MKACRQLLGWTSTSIITYFLVVQPRLTATSRKTLILLFFFGSSSHGFTARADQFSMNSTFVVTIRRVLLYKIETELQDDPRAVNDLCVKSKLLMERSISSGADPRDSTDCSTATNLCVPTFGRRIITCQFTEFIPKELKRLSSELLYQIGRYSMPTTV